MRFAARTLRALLIRPTGVAMVRLAQPGRSSFSQRQNKRAELLGLLGQRNHVALVYGSQSPSGGGAAARYARD
jgi:hypothetical protein